MALGVASACINHPSIEAIGRCKQCGKPFCSACRVVGPTGNFCCEQCKTSHEKFIERAHQYEKMGKGGGFMVKLWWLGKKVLIFAVFFLIVAVALTYFGIEIPFVSEQIRRLLNL